MINSRVRRVLRLEQFAIAFTSVAFGLLMSILANRLSDQMSNLIPFILVVAVIGAIATAFLYLRQRPGAEVVIRAPITIRTPQEGLNNARRGYIGFVPLFKPSRASAANQLTPEERQHAVDVMDFAALDLPNSNLQPTITAITTHASRLEHCWLFTTAGTNKSAKGSQPYASLLAAYLKRECGLDCQFYYGDAYRISMDDDALVLDKTYRQVRQVFSQAERLGLEPREIIADITTGTRSMMLGIVLACLDLDHDIEFIGSDYNMEGQPEGPLIPMIFSVEAHIAS